MSVIANSKHNWPSNRTGLSLGRDGYVVVSFNNGTNFYELETIKDISFNVNWATSDLSARLYGCDKYLVPTTREFSISTDAIFDANDNTLKSLIENSVCGNHILVGGFTESGSGPLFWGIATLDVSEEFAGLVKANIKFTCTQFITYYLGLSNDHPISKCAPRISEFQNNDNGGNNGGNGGNGGDGPELL